MIATSSTLTSFEINAVNAVFDAIFEMSQRHPDFEIVGGNLRNAGWHSADPKIVDTPYNAYLKTVLASTNALAETKKDNFPILLTSYFNKWSSLYVRDGVEDKTTVFKDAPVYSDFLLNGSPDTSLRWIGPSNRNSVGTSFELSLVLPTKFQSLVAKHCENENLISALNQKYITLDLHLFETENCEARKKWAYYRTPGRDSRSFALYTASRLAPEDQNEKEPEIFVTARTNYILA